MLDRTKILSTAATLIVAALSSTAATAGNAVSIPPVIGAAYTSAVRADSAADVRRQGGFASAGAVRWLVTAPDDVAPVAVFHVPGVIGASRESLGLARSADETRRQGGFATAGAVRWLVRAPESQTLAAF